MTTENLPTMATVQARVFSLPGRPSFMIVYDLAEFYRVKPARIMEQVRRNIGRFPDDFIFELTDAEYSTLVTQNALPNRVNRGALFGFTKEGALQLSSVLTGPVADTVSVTIMRAFAAMERQALAETQFLLFKLQREAAGEKPIRRAILDGVRAGLSFEVIWRSGNYSRPRLALAARECLALGLIAALPSGTPAMQLEMFGHA